MTPATISAGIVADRAAWIRKMIDGIHDLPLEPQAFHADPRTAAAAESFLRRALEALLDLGRHVLSKGFGRGVAEYKAIAEAMREVGVFGEADAALMVQLAGYRDRMVHFYHAIGDEELRLICRDQLGDVERLLTAVLNWLRAHPEMLDRSL